MLTLGLLALVLALAVLQYRWTQQLVASQRALQANAVRTSVSRMQNDLGGLFQDIYSHFEREPMRTASLAGAMADQWQAWQDRRPYPRLIEAMYWVTQADSALHLQVLKRDNPALQSTAWPPELEAWRAYFETTFAELEIEPDQSLDLSLSAPPLLGDQPGLVFPLFDSPSPDQPVSFVFVHLRRATLAEAVLPDLMATHGAALQADYVVRVVMPSQAVLYQSEAEWTPAVATPDTSVTMVWPLSRNYHVKMEERGVFLVDRAEMVLSLPSREGGEMGSQLQVYHRAGSLDIAMQRLKVRQLGLASGLLLVLAGALVLLYVVAQRARRLGDQQMAFVAGISHELRTPVAAITALAENMTAGIVRDEVQTRSYGELIHNEGLRLKEMVEQVLDYAASQSNSSNTKQPVSVQTLLDNTLAHNRAYLTNTKLTVNYGAAADLYIWADAQALEVALRNLLLNAVKHGPAEGPVEVTVEQVDGQNKVQIYVTDHGPGIPADEQARIFEPFFRGERARDQQVQGNGLGLSLVRRIVYAHGGTVHVRSTPGDGAAFTLRFPLTDPPMP